MRHDAHYVDTLAASAATPVGRMVPIDRVDPNPDQPRQAMLGIFLQQHLEPHIALLVPVGGERGHGVHNSQGDGLPRQQDA